MAYTALYRKFRPASFDEVRGQDHIVKTLRNQIRADRLGHAYLFCGTRGTGKTSISKIFAKAVNCEQPIEGSPCNECRMCKAISSGASLNVIEIDAASNNGVDSIREIRDEVTYSPVDGRFKVYIIDEVHMLSTGAFNALLKTLEEPPSYVIFILATTEALKIPVTILSRCQRFNYRRIGQDTILEQLIELSNKEGIAVEEKALRYIARKADGAMRDALSLLDQCISFYLGETLTYDRVLEALGAVDTDVFSKWLRQLLAGKLTQAIGTLEQLIMQGRDITQLVSDFTWYMRNLMLLKASEEMEDILDVSTENLRQLREEASMVRSDTLMRFIRIFSELSNNIRNSTNKRVLVELALIKVCKPESERDELSLLERLRKLERAMERGMVVRRTDSASQPIEVSTDTAEPEIEPEAPKRAAPADLQRVSEQWKSIISGTRQPFITYLSSASVKFNGDNSEDNRLYVIFSDYLAERCVNSPEHKAELEKLILERVGKEVEVKLLLAEDEKIQKGTLARVDAKPAFPEAIHMEIETLEEEEGDFFG